MQVTAILLAAGKGQRFKSLISKPLVKLGECPIINYSLKVLNRHPLVKDIILVVNSANKKAMLALVKKSGSKKISSLVPGGARRQDSVFNALKKVSTSSDLVLIHDSARPFVQAGTVTKVIRQAKKYGAAILAVRPKATIKSSRPDNTVAETFNRDKLWEIQTPQVFEKNLLLKAYKKYSKDKVTDDASLVEKLGKRVKVVKGSYGNIKITTNEDLLFAGVISRKA